MELLSDLLLDDSGEGPTYSVEIADERSEQSVVIESTEPLAGYSLEEAEWPEGERHPDGVIVGQVEGTIWVCFIELKSTMKPKEDKENPGARALSQLEGGVRHFHPENRGMAAAGHGSGHHDRFAHGSDELEVTPPKNHRVIGIAVGFRHVPRPPPTATVEIGNSNTRLVIVPLSGNERNRRVISFRDLLRLAGEL